MVKGNCATCQIPMDISNYPMCSPCVLYWKKATDKDFAEMAIRCFGKTRKEADEWLASQSATQLD